MFFFPTLCTTYRRSWLSSFILIKQGFSFKFSLMGVCLHSPTGTHIQNPTLGLMLCGCRLDTLKNSLTRGPAFLFCAGPRNYLAELARIIYFQITQRRWLERVRIEVGKFIIPETCMLWADTDTREMISESRAGEQDEEVVFQLSSHIFASGLIMGFIVWIPWIAIDC